MHKSSAMQWYIEYYQFHLVYRYEYNDCSPHPTEFYGHHLHCRRTRQWRNGRYRRLRTSSHRRRGSARPPGGMYWACHAGTTPSAEHGLIPGVAGISERAGLRQHVCFEGMQKLVLTAISNELTQPSRGLVAALRHSISRNEFFAGLYILGCANGLLGRILLTLNRDGWTGLLDVDVSVIVLFACFAGISILLQEEGDEIRSADLAVGGVFLVLVILPIFALSWLAVTGLSLYILVFANDGSARRRGALILLALTVPMLWSRLLFQFF